LKPFVRVWSERKKENGGCCLRMSTEEEVREAHIRTKSVWIAHSQTVPAIDSGLSICLGY